MNNFRVRNILIVEDEEPLARMIQWELESNGYQAHMETSGKGALDYILEKHPDLVILDLRLPDIHGYEVCRQVRKLSTWWTPVLMLTALNQPVDQLRGYAFGADAYLTKPVDNAELLKTVALLLEELSPA